jgi:fumarate reductase flavoprotein subunit
MTSTRPVADIIVVGSGMAAHRAALEALRLGVTVLMLEKMPTIGGSTVMSGGSFAFAGTDLQQASGIEDSLDRLRDDLVTNGGGDAQLNLIELYVTQQLNEYRFLREKGVVFGPIQLSSGQSVPRSHPAHPAGVLRLLNECLTGSPAAQLRTGFAALRLRRSTAYGPIDQVLLSDGSVAQARLGIILATGGFSRSEDLLKLFVPDIRKALRAGGKGNEGDGLKLAWEHGAGFADLGHVKSTFGSWIEVDEVDPHTTLLPVYRGAIAVNLDGERFISESRSYKTLGKAVLGQRDARAWQIFDAGVMAGNVPGVPSFDFQAALRKGRIIEAGSISDLAKKARLPADRLIATIDRYNEDANASGIDRVFGREALAHRFGQLVPIATPPFYGYLCTASINSTYAGLRVNPSMNVLDVWGDPITGLFAAGEVVGGFHGEAYMTGSSLVKALVFGAQAARSLLESRETL